jgi:hypothetical protein
MGLFEIDRDKSGPLHQQHRRRGGSSVLKGRSAGGIASGTTVQSGGFESVLSGGIASATILSGGTLEVASGGSTGSGPITFTNAGGILQLDDFTTFSWLNRWLCLTLRRHRGDRPGDISFGKKTKVSFKEDKNHLSGTLTVTDGTHTGQPHIARPVLGTKFQPIQRRPWWDDHCRSGGRLWRPSVFCIRAVGPTAPGEGGAPSRT